MEGGDGWQMLRCAGGEVDKSVTTNRTMLRFRPIAPKPVDTGATAPTGNKNSVLTSGRKKRKYVRVQNNSGYTRRKKKEQEITKDDLAAPPNGVVRTLQLLPESTVTDHSTDGGSWYELDHTVSNNNKNPPIGEDQGLPMWLSSYMGGGCSDPTVGMQLQEMMVKSLVTVECVTGTCMNVQGTFGVGRCTDADRMRNLEGDACPGFISDGENRVQWLNGAFKRMVSQGNYTSEIAVWLAIKEKLPYTHWAFTCQVKLQYMVGKEKYSRMVPCDLWRMDGGGFAWRLDVKAALTLGR
ncbi:unnamed protein product [Prunus armeniaca]|uniref:DUF7950 domain-containing protein n=1 Tax=Prunus armeniaca TaxID=36596 RepID=A0A6J5X0Q6_PRUAR|nr:hypothetical protein GBA52_028836 [Prunus armeniaca]KAH0984598.1 hypothetical protein GBA52_011775 [Prunus armeniaca]CAB4275279.1 unnamed protein product [Prunus armeniaca]CAB4305765.1 unnamed protein product [Prunus armeniaca]